MIDRKDPTGMGKLACAIDGLNDDIAVVERIQKASAPRAVFEIEDDGPPQFQMAPAGAIVWIETESSEPGTLLVDPVPDLVCDSLLGMQVQRVKKTEIATGRVEWYFEILPVGDTGEITQYYCIERPNGVITYSDGRLQSAEERAQLLKAKQRFFSGE